MLGYGYYAYRHGELQKHAELIVALAAVKEAAETYNALVEVGERLPEMRRVVPYVAETTWRLDSLTALSTRFTSRRHVIELWPHERFRLFKWLARIVRAERLLTITLRRVKNCIYAVFIYEAEPERVEEPAAVTAFEINENVVVAAWVNIYAVADRVAQWNSRWISSLISIKIFRAGFSRLAKRYGAVRHR